MSEPIVVDTNLERIDFECVHSFLRESYWAKGVPAETLRRAIAGSLCFGLYEGERQIGFARVVSDFATFAYLADVFVVESHRGRGLARRLMDAVDAHPRLQGLRRWMLVTRICAGDEAWASIRSVESEVFPAHSDSPELRAKLLEIIHRASEGRWD